MLKSMILKTFSIIAKFNASFVQELKRLKLMKNFVKIPMIKVATNQIEKQEKETANINVNDVIPNLF